MKKFEVEINFIVLITFSLTMIIIFVGVFMNFFSEEGGSIIIALIGVGGAILGGVISGGMTLKGVKRTIKHENDIRMKDQIPQKIELIRKSEITIKEIRNVVDRTMKFNYGKYETNKEILFEDASKIDHECYNQLLKIEQTIIQFKNDNWIMILRDDEYGGEITTTTKTIEIFENFKFELKKYEEILNKKMLHYLEKISD
ncbi:hypothetical protein ACMGD3_21905 [Lysinibacillus sphaericus]|uniref:hypothetical protein n=1 Tax=Lysinibacillus sphaericus TaxID=1421 RepID=UPI003F792ECD